MRAPLYSPGTSPPTRRPTNEERRRLRRRASAMHDEPNGGAAASEAPPRPDWQFEAVCRPPSASGDARGLYDREGTRKVSCALPTIPSLHPIVDFAMFIPSDVSSICTRPRRWTTGYPAPALERCTSRRQRWPGTSRRTRTRRERSARSTRNDAL